MSANVGKILMDKEILLESGTNELEVLVFNIAEFNFGINVAKVREVFPRPNITALAKSHPSVRGVFRLRDQVVPCVSLVDHLDIDSTGADAESTMILTDFNQQQTAFLVDRVERIHRLSWEKVMGMPPLDALRQTPVTAIVHCDGRLIVMLDFEMIIDQVTRQAYRVGAIENSHNLPREALRIIMCDDSPTIRQAVSNTLRESGYTQLEIFENGAQAWRWIEERLAETGVADGVADLVISDIEMPQVDGLHLTKRIKEHPQLRELPVLLYSSIITPDNMKKGKAVGANIQISKPELNKIVEVADGLIAEARGAAGDATANRAESLSAAEERSEACAPAATKTAASPAKVESVAAEVASAEPDARADARADVASPANSAKGAAAERKSSSRRKSPAKKSADESLPAGVPHGVSGQLWQTFLDELADHIAALTRQIADAAGDSPGEEAQNIFRTLHTIKSASMVIPCAPITRATHAVEGLLTPLRRTPAEWPTAILASYVAWLETIANPMIDVNEALSLAPIAQLFAEPGQPAS